MVNDIELKQKAFDVQIKKLQKQFGSDFLISLEDIPPIPVIKTRLLSLNLAFGVGGLPLGRVIEIVGDEGSGKTTLSLTLFADVLNAGHKAVYVDIERKVTAEYATKLGVPLSAQIIRPASADAAAIAIDGLAGTGAVSVIFVDSVAQMVTESELEKEVNDSNVGNIPRLLSQAFRRLVPKLSMNEVTLVFINQYRQEIGKMFGNPNKSSGGRSLQYASSLKLEMRDGQRILEDKAEIGKEIKIKISKNQLGGSPGKEVVLKMLHTQGFDIYDDFCSAVLSKGVVKLNGSYFYFGDENVAQGRAGFIEVLKENKELFNKITDKFYEVL